MASGSSCWPLRVVQALLQNDFSGVSPTAAEEWEEGLSPPVREGRFSMSDIVASLLSSR